MTVKSKWVSGDVLFVRLTKTAVTSGNIPIGVVGVEYFEWFDDTFDVISEWGNEYAKRVAGIREDRATPFIHMSRTFMRRFTVGNLVKFEKVSRSVVRLGRAGDGHV